jgi:hypothetical protein
MKANGRALTKWRRNGAHAQARKNPLQQTLRAEPRHRIDYCLPLKNPAGHRKANRRIEQMHLSHIHPPNPGSSATALTLRGGTLSSSIGTIAIRPRLNKAQQCHRSGTEVIGVIGGVNSSASASGGCPVGRPRPPRAKARSPFPGAPFLVRFLREKWGFSTERSRRVRAFAARSRTDAHPHPQCAGIASSVARPAGGTTTVDKLPSTVSF